MKPTDFWLVAIAVILTLILIRLSAIAERIRAHFPTGKEVGYEKSGQIPAGPQ